jgi:sugar phosphate permease
VAIYAAGFGCVKMLHYGFVFWLPYFITNFLGTSGPLEALLASTYDIGGIFGSLAGGYAIDRYLMRAPVVVPMIGLSVPFLLAFRFGSVIGLWFYFLVIPCTGFLIAGAHNLIAAAISADLAQNEDVKSNKEALGTVAGIIDGSGGLGAAIGQTLIGYLSTLGWDYVFIFLMGRLYVGIAAVAFATLFPMVIKEFRRKKTKLLEDFPLDSDDLSQPT